jgi:CRISPR-associated endonuclease/helicase Cas3
MNHWGRIFFTYSPKGILSDVQGQPLDNHVGNTRRILAQFQAAYFYEPTRSRLLKAAALHDEGKKETFRIIDHHGREKEPTDPAVEERFAYSFAGHRFRVPGYDPYIDGLIRSHHEFSVEQINREKSKLSAEEQTHFADDLYLLCMADQLEAELAVKSVERRKGDIPRTFMEFVTRRIEDRPYAYTVSPWPFEPQEFSIDLALKRPLLDNVAKLTGRQIQKVLKEHNDFEEQTLSITLRRD